MTSNMPNISMINLSDLMNRRFPSNRRSRRKEEDEETLM